MKTISNAVLLTLSFASVSLMGQDMPVPHAVMGGVMWQAGVPVTGVRQFAVEYIGGEMGMAGKPVKGAPYSAEAVTETIQVLADGNRIRNRSVSQVYRDSEGRTRREPALGNIGMAADVQMPQLVFISDPVTGFNYVLDLKQRTAQKMAITAPDKRLAELKASLRHAPAEAGTFEMHVTEAPGPGAVETFAYKANAEHQQAQAESLGRQTIEGVAADGSRSTFSIAAGKIGNDRPIDVVSERWYSPELQTMVMSKHSDPRMGETVYRLSNINRSEPAHSLFEVPADFKINEAAAGDMLRMRPRPAEPVR